MHVLVKLSRCSLDMKRQWRAVTGLGSGIGGKRPGVCRIAPRSALWLAKAKLLSSLEALATCVEFAISGEWDKVDQVPLCCFGSNIMSSKAIANLGSDSADRSLSLGEVSCLV